MKTKLLVVDDNKNIINLISDYFSSSSEVEVIFKASDGEEAIEIIKSRRNEFNFILLDLIMPKRDGIAVLNYIKKNDINIPIIVMSSYDDMDMIKCISEYGVKHYILKPFDLNDLNERIINIINLPNRKSVISYDKKIMVETTKLLHALGMPSHIKGYDLIRTGIIMVYNNPNFVGGITKELYPDLSIKFKTSVQRVERAIRHAIEVSWMRGDINLMEEIFGHSVDLNKSKPTNSEFIVTIADKLKLEMLDVK